MSPEQLTAHPVTRNMVVSADALANGCTYSTTALLALAQFHQDNDDEAGAELLREFAARFAVHEASTL